VLIERFVPTKVFENLLTHKITILPGAPAMFYALLQIMAQGEVKLPDLRLMVSGGAPLPAATFHALEKAFGIPVLEGDGPTECSPVTSVNPVDGVRKVGSVGIPLPGVEIAIFDEADKALPAEEVGEIVVRGDNVMLGYLNQPEETAEAMKSGWYHTGDMGKIDAEGYVYIVDRKKDMLITAGLNVYPREIEEVLFAHPAVAIAAVIGLADAVRGEEVTAVVVLKPGATATDRELISFCRERLANYKVPRKVLFREMMPMGGSGKVVKRLLKKELELEATS
jgi:long-chain acyl-CoA synthetase